LIYVDPSGHSWLSDMGDSIRGSIDPIKIYQNGGVKGLVLWGAEPVGHSFQYTDDGGFATGGGYHYGVFIFGGGWQEKGPNHGFYGYVGSGKNFGDSGASIGIILTHNFTQGTNSIGISVGYTHDSGANGSLSYDVTNDSWSGSLGWTGENWLEKHNDYWELDVNGAQVLIADNSEEGVLRSWATVNNLEKGSASILINNPIVKVKNGYILPQFIHGLLLSGQ
jgi:hypothetical protein